MLVVPIRAHLYDFDNSCSQIVVPLCANGIVHNSVGLEVVAIDHLSMPTVADRAGPPGPCVRAHPSCS
jgi:hypothetical protein